MTTFTEKYLQPNIYNENRTFDEYCAELPEIYLKPQVPEPVRESFVVIESLMAFSYFNHLFVDSALTQALHTFEMALKLKDKELNPNKKWRGLKSTIARFITDDLFESQKEVLKIYEDWRNQKAHPEDFYVGGPIFMYAIVQLCRLINDLYEDIELRKERITAFVEFKKLQTENKLDNYLVYDSPKGIVKLFNIQLVFINNKVSPAECTFVYVPLFKLGTSVQMEAVRIINPKIENGVLKLTDALSKKEYIFHPYTYNHEVRAEFKEWNNHWKEYDKAHLYHLEIVKLHACCFIPLMMQFYKV